LQTHTQRLEIRTTLANFCRTFAPWLAGIPRSL
jgi:hypothetical protein